MKSTQIDALLKSGSLFTGANPTHILFPVNSNSITHKMDTEAK